MNSVEITPPTFCVAESGVRSSGNWSSISLSARMPWSYSTSEIVGESST